MSINVNYNIYLKYANINKFKNNPLVTSEQVGLWQ